MPIHDESAITFLIPRCFRRKKTPPTPESAGNIFEQRMKQQLKKQNKRSYRAKHTRPRPPDDVFVTFDLLFARDRSVATKNAHQTKHRHWPHEPSWDSFADTYLSPPSSVGAEAGGIIGTTHTKNPRDEDIDVLSRYKAQLKQQEISKEAAFRLQQLAQLDMRNYTTSFMYQVPRPSARSWSITTTNGSAGDDYLPRNSFFSPSCME